MTGAGNSRPICYSSKRPDCVSGTGKDGVPETVSGLTLTAGECLAVVGPTGSGKSELLSDIDQMASRDTLSGRRVLLNETQPARSVYEDGIVAQLSQKTGFLMDGSVADFIRLQVLSGGQSRALMIADIACIFDAPVVLIDEIENAGIDKLKALAVLMEGVKLIIVSTHDPILTLMAGS